MGSMTKGSSVLLLLLVSFVLVSMDEIVGVNGTREMVGVEEKSDAEEFTETKNPCYDWNESFGFCIVGDNCNRNCKMNKYPLGGACLGFACICWTKRCITMESQVY